MNFALKELEEPFFEGCDISGFDWSGISIEGVNFSNSNLTNISFKNAVFVKCNFSGTNLVGSNFENADFSKSDFKKAKYEIPELKKSLSVKYCDFEGSNWSNSNIKEWNLTGANLKNIILSNSELAGVILTDAILEGADMASSSYQLDDLLQANLKNTKLQGEISISAGFGGFKGELVIWELNSNNKKDIAGKNKFSKVQSLKFDGNSGFTGTEE
jgi:uncharacterized protein YjbI with pentapeptide repeats